MLGLMLAAVPAAARDVVKNGGFEHEELAGWTVERFAGDGRAERITPGAEGEWALRLSVSRADVVGVRGGTTSVNPMRVTQVIEPPPLGELLTVSAFGRADAPEGHAAIRVEVLGKDGIDVYRAREQSWPSGQGTTRRELQLYVPPEAASLRITLELAGAGDAVFDAVRAETSPAPTFAPGVNVLQNAGFERGEAGWSPFGRDDDHRLGVTADAARQGSGGARIDGRGGKLVANWGQEVLGPSFSGQDIVLAGWFRTENVDGRAFLGIFVWGIDPKGRPFQRFQPFEEDGISGTTGWTLLHKRVSLAGLSVHGIVVRACLRGTGTVDVDDLEAGLVAPPQRRASRVPWAVAATAGLLAVLALILLARRRRGTAALGQR